MTPSLTGLLARWEQAQDAGQALDLDDLCADRPELRGTLAQAVEALARLRDLMRRTDDAAATLGPAPSAASLLQRWERSRDEGHTLSAEELAPGRPDLHPALRGALGLLAAARPVLARRQATMRHGESKRSRKWDDLGAPLDVSVPGTLM